jgi:hypothetical protein
MRHVVALLTVVAAVSAVARAQTTTRPANPTADEMFKQLLAPQRPSTPPLTPLPDAPQKDATTLKTVAPGGQQQNLVREGTRLFDRTGRLTKTAEGMTELTFDADGQGMKDPPMLILPNLNLMGMEKAVASASRDLKFRVTGLVTEYNGRNYILLDKFVVVSDVTTPAGNTK